MAPNFALPALPVATVSGSVKAAIPALTVMLVNGALNFLAATLILIAGWTAARWFGRWLHGVLGRAHYIDATLKPLLANFARYGILAVTIVAVLGQFGVQTTSLIALLGATSLALGLALQGTLSNVASGVMLLFLRPFRVAEKIVVADVTGTVREIGLFRTVLVTDEGLYVSLPNSTIFSGVIVNNSREAMRRTNFSVDVDHGEDIGAAQRTILAALNSDSRVLKTPAPDVQVESVLGPTVVMSVQAWINNSDFGGQQADLKRIARQALETARISPPIPIPAPSVAPWTPPADNAENEKRRKPN